MQLIINDLIKNKILKNERKCKPEYSIKEVQAIF